MKRIKKFIQRIRDLVLIRRIGFAQRGTPIENFIVDMIVPEVEDYDEWDYDEERYWED